jgi:predicted signal transduction protein with EAL and GGDEF domain
LIEAGRRLDATIRAGDTVARFGGDEFTILLADLAGEADAVDVAERVLAALREPLVLEGRPIAISASIGIAIAASHGLAGSAAAETLLHDADIAMYHAKSTGKGRAVLFTEEMSVQAAQRLDRELALRQAVEAGEFRLEYQPIVDLHTGALVGVEALVRRQHPDHGLIGPSDFIPLAEETGLIIPIGAWVLREACRQACIWRETFAMPDLQINVNLSARQFAEPDLAEQIGAVLAETGLPAANLCLEVTESAAMSDPEVTIRTLQAVRALGVRVAIDDFGTGYSALSYLQRFPVDTVKIDRSFVAEVAHGRGTAIVRAVTSLAHALGMQVTAEGVETSEQVRRLSHLSCDSAQGYHFARPLAAEALTALLESSPSVHAAGGWDARAG